jgi:tetratricopeptide (TPR) repeat protein
VKYNLALSYTQLSLDQEKNKNYKSAVSLLNKAVQYNNYDEAYFLLARNYVEDNQYDNAIQSSEKALKYRKNIKESGPDYYLGVAYSQKGEMTKAEEYLNKAKKDPVYKSSAEEILKAINK